MSFFTIFSSYGINEIWDPSSKPTCQNLFVSITEIVSFQNDSLQRWNSYFNVVLYYSNICSYSTELTGKFAKKSLSNNFKRLLLNGSLIFKKNFHNVFPATQVIQGYAKACWARTLVSTSKSYWCMIKVQTIFKTGKNGRPDCIRLTDQQTHHN